MRAVLVAVLVVVLAACDTIPRDPEGTLQRVRGDVLRAGYTVAHPWAGGPADDPEGVEVDLVERFAEELGATVEWTEGSEAELFEALEVRALDLVVGGFDASDPWVSSAGVTRPYATTQLMVGMPEDEPAPDDLAGMTIAVEAGSDAQGLVAKAGATPAPVADITTARGPAAVDDWMLDDLRLAETDHVLAEHKHVLAAPLGENAFLVALERFLFRERTTIEAAIAEAGPA
jgi:polar amino acid transport system substrate-binding protein